MTTNFEFHVGHFERASVLGDYIELYYEKNILKGTKKYGSFEVEINDDFVDN